MNLYFELTRSSTSVRNVAALLKSIVMIYDGLNLMENGNETELIEEIKRRFPQRYRDEIAFTIDDLKAGGNRVIAEHNRPMQGTMTDVYWSYIITEADPEDRGIELVAISKGSLSVVIQDIIESASKKMREVFKKIMTTSASLTMNDEGEEVKSSLIEFFESINNNAGTKLLGAGAVMLGAQNLQKSYNALGITDVSIY